MRKAKERTPIQLWSSKTRVYTRGLEDVTNSRRRRDRIDYSQEYTNDSRQAKCQSIRHHVLY